MLVWCNVGKNLSTHNIILKNTRQICTVYVYLLIENFAESEKCMDVYTNVTPNIHKRHFFAFHIFPFISCF